MRNTRTLDRVTVGGTNFAYGSAVHRALYSADAGLMDVLRKDSTVPLDPFVLVPSLDPGEASSHAFDLIHMALISRDKLHALRMALELGCSPNSLHATAIPDGFLVQPAIFALLSYARSLGPDGIVEALRLLVQAGADLHMPTGMGRMYLNGIVMAAIQVDDQRAYPAFEALLKAAMELGADPNLPDCAPCPPYPPQCAAVTALKQWHGRAPQPPQYAVQFMMRVLQILKDAGADLRPEASTIFMPFVGKNLTTTLATNYLKEAVQDNYVDIVQWTVDNVPVALNLSLGNMVATYLFRAAGAGSVDAAQVLLRAGADPTVRNITGKTAARVAMGRLKYQDVNGDEEARRRARAMVALLEQAEQDWRRQHEGSDPG